MTSPLRFQVGEIEVTRILELEFPLGRQVLPIGQRPDELAASCGWAKPHFLTDAGDIVFALTTVALVSEGRTIVIDPCCSFDLRRGNPDIAERAAELLDERLPAAGFPPEDIDLVLNTHLDGVGWNVRPGPDGWRPAFPNARCVWTRAEIDRATNPPSDDAASAADGASLAPLIASGVLEKVEAPYAATKHVSLRPSPGHTAGNVDIWIESGGASAVIVGDHVLSPLQCADPDWTGLDALPDAAPGTRRALLQECAERDTLVIGPHFGTPGAGRVRREGDAWRLDAEPGRGPA